MSILLKNISKNYGAQKALKEVTLTIEKGPNHRTFRAKRCW